jgi:hypothetical protein
MHTYSLPEIREILNKVPISLLTKIALRYERFNYIDSKNWHDIDILNDNLVNVNIIADGIIIHVVENVTKYELQKELKVHILEQEAFNYGTVD